jgi:hypothetical protein
VAQPRRDNGQREAVCVADALIFRTDFWCRKECRKKRSPSKVAAFSAKAQSYCQRRSPALRSSEEPEQRAAQFMYEPRGIRAGAKKPRNQQTNQHAQWRFLVS